MTSQVEEKTAELEPVLVLGATGKTGRRIVDRLEKRGVSVRRGSRSAFPAFDWAKPEKWWKCLEGVRAVYISYTPDLAMPGAKEAIQALCEMAEFAGVERIVLLSGRGEEEAQACEQLVQKFDMEWTIIRASWFSQNFTEGAFAQMVLTGEIALPAGTVREPFIDIDDIAEIAEVSLLDEGHANQLYEVTGPELMTFSDIADELSLATGRKITFSNIGHMDFIRSVAGSRAPKDVIWMLDYLFSTVLDGRNESVTDGVFRALGRPPRSFRDFARNTVLRGAWTSAA